MDQAAGLSGDFYESAVFVDGFVYWSSRGSGTFGSGILETLTYLDARAAELAAAGFPLELHVKMVLATDQVDIAEDQLDRLQASIAATVEVRDRNVRPYWKQDGMMTSNLMAWGRSGTTKAALLDAVKAFFPDGEWTQLSQSSLVWNGTQTTRALLVWASVDIEESEPPPPG